MPPDRPEYKVYRSGRGGLLRGGRGLDALRRRGARRPPPPPKRPGLPRRDRQADISPARVLRWVAFAVAGWIALSLVLFMVSAQLQEGPTQEVGGALSSGGNLFTGSTVLVLGSDARAGDSIDKSQRGPGLADSIMLVRASFGSVRKLSIPRDSLADIPGHGRQKINAAYAIGGPGLMIETVEGFLGNGLEVNHVVEVDFEDFPELIDALGGITVNNKTCVRSPPFDNFFKGFTLPKGEVELDGREALGYARVRKNACAPTETDLDRAARQQRVLTGIRDSLVSPSAFLRLPLISWQAPKTIETDMAGPSLFGLFADLATGNKEETRVLQPSVLAGSLEYSDSEKADAVEQLLGR